MRPPNQQRGGRGRERGRGGRGRGRGTPDDDTPGGDGLEPEPEPLCDDTAIEKDIGHVLRSRVADGPSCFRGRRC